MLKLLNVLLSTETASEDKCQILEEDFKIKMTQTLESEVSLMCNLSKGVEEQGIQKGTAKRTGAGNSGNDSCFEKVANTHRNHLN